MGRASAPDAVLAPPPAGQEGWARDFRRAVAADAAAGAAARARDAAGAAPQLTVSRAGSGARGLADAATLAPLCYCRHSHTAFRGCCARGALCTICGGPVSLAPS